jgi:hypothetical protein
MRPLEREAIALVHGHVDFRGMKGAWIVAIGTAGEVPGMRIDVTADALGGGPHHHHANRGRRRTGRLRVATAALGLHVTTFEGVLRLLVQRDREERRPPAVYVVT